MISMVGYIHPLRLNDTHHNSLSVPFLPSENRTIASLDGPLEVLGQNGSGQNGMNKMVWTKWYKYNGADKIINQSINPVPTDDMIFSSILLSLESLYISSVCLALFVTSG